MPLPISLVDRRAVRPDTAADHALVTPARIVGTVASAAGRAVAAALSGVLLIGGVALVLWAVTPGSGTDADGVLHGGVVAFAAAHFLPIRIGDVPVTIHPLLLTVIAVAVIASAAGRARMVRGRTLEALHASVFSLGYAIVVDVVVVVAAPPGSAEPGLLAPLCVAAAGSLLGLAAHRTAWNRWWRHWAAPWLRVGLRAGAMAVCLLLAAGALAVSIGLGASLPDATAVSRLAAGSTGGSAGEGLGLLLLGLAFLPNAVIAGVGYVSGAGFSLGAGSYSPLLVQTADLPAIPLLTAAPDGPATRASLLALLAPLVAGLLIAVLVCRAVDTRRERLIAAAVACVGAGVAVAGLAAIARGGVAGGPWASTGVDPVLAGGLVTGALLLVAGSWTALSGLRAVAWAAPSEWRRDGADGALEDELDAPEDDGPAADGGDEGDRTDAGDGDANLETDAETGGDTDAETDAEADGDTDAEAGAAEQQRLPDTG